MMELDSLRGRAKPFFYCGGQASRIISVKNLLIAISSFLLIFLGGVTLASASEVTALQAKDNRFISNSFGKAGLELGHSLILKGSGEPGSFCH
jgi:hypothetical protein